MDHLLPAMLTCFLLTMGGSAWLIEKKQKETTDIVKKLEERIDKIESQIHGQSYASNKDKKNQH